MTDASNKPSIDTDVQIRQLQEMFLQSPSFSALLHGPEHRFVLTNPAYQQLVGHRDVIGLTVREAFPEVERQGFVDLLGTVFRTGEAFAGKGVEIVFQPPDGRPAETRYLDFVCQPIEDEIHKVFSIFVQGVDVTERHRKEEALRTSEARLRQLNADLERQVLERTQARGLTWKLSPDLLGALNSKGYFETANPAWEKVLGWTEEEVVSMSIFDLAAAQEALRQSQKIEAIGHLTGGIAHDFNNLLTGIIGSLDIIRRRMAEDRLDDIPRFMDAASTSAQRAAALTHRLLAFARRQSLDVRPNDINRLVASMEDMLHRTLGEHIQLEFTLSADLWTAFTDANQLESALLNLAINARDAMPDGGRLTIETTNVRLDAAYTSGQDDVSPGDYVVTAVSDTGSGMPADVVAKAVDPFFTTKPVGEGTGLGLSMIYGFAKQTRGHLRIYSEVGHGTTVKLYLPRALQDAVVLAKPAKESPRGQGETILIVEDDATVRLILSDVSEELGYNVVLASDALIDLMVSDVVLPHINGRKLAEIARTARPDLKILFVSGYAEHATFRGEFLEPGMDMLTKPFALDALGAKVRAMIER
jgi:PAS domain S-box-containing protein